MGAEKVGRTGGRGKREEGGEGQRGVGEENISLTHLFILCTHLIGYMYMK